ncbi:Transposase [Phytophthora megakarya]|uniref:Transposase n=1 Tax=Phytophthora megakarya TaxID=4795 RepID=A0A225W6P0_9STRA|nr:Transposase [Phytophthora megakarya]
MRQPVRQTVCRQNGGGLSSAGTTKLAVLEGSQNSDSYVYILSEYLLRYAHRTYGTDFMFQQDNASIHTSVRAKEFFQEQELSLARSPDLNPIENLWAIISRAVYPNGKQYQNVAELTKAVVHAWNTIPDTTLANLVDNSMPTRCIEVLGKKGGKTLYYTFATPNWRSQSMGSQPVHVCLMPRKIVQRGSPQVKTRGCTWCKQRELRPAMEDALVEYVEENCLYTLTQM